MRPVREACGARTRRRLSKVTGTGPKKPYPAEDVRRTSKLSSRNRAAPAAGSDSTCRRSRRVRFPPNLGRCKCSRCRASRKLSGAICTRNSISIPHVTQHDEADITELEAFRKSQAEEAKKEGIRITLIGFLLKAVVVALKQYPSFNSSLSADGENLILKQYFHIGVAVDTPLGLVVPGGCATPTRKV